MSVRKLTAKPESMAHFPDDKRYTWLELHSDGQTYGHAAVAERDDALELHVTLTGWGSRVVRNMTEDLVWLKSEAKRRGKTRIMGIRANGQGKFDHRLFKFARLFGFTEMCVFQTASLYIK